VCVTAPRSARRDLLLRRRGLRRNVDVTEWPSELHGVDARAGLGPVLGGELEGSGGGPVGKEADDVGEIGLGVEAVELARGDEGEDVGGGRGVIVAAAEEPGITADGNP